MFSYLYNTFIFKPLYNGLIGLMAVFPWMDAGVAVIIFTIIVRLILFPLSKKAIVTQVRMKEVQPELDQIKKSGDRQSQALATMKLYRDKKISPFSSFFVLLIQLPIIYGLYSIFINSGLPTINQSLLYFSHIPVINMQFLGLMDIGMKNVFLAVCAAAAQFFQLHYSLSAMKTAPTGNPQMDMAQNMTRSMKWIFPIIVFVISYQISAVVALYWTVSSLFTLAQELVVRRHLDRHESIA